MPDPDFYAECLQASFDDLLAAATALNAAPATKTAAKKPARTRKSTPRKTAKPRSKGVGSTATRTPAKASAARITEESK